jgi:hypothetical protein
MNSWPDCMKAPAEPVGRLSRVVPCRSAHRRQLLYGFITEGVNLLHVVATPGKPEPLIAGLIQCERGLPDPEERGCLERTDQLCVRHGRTVTAKSPSG